MQIIIQGHNKMDVLGIDEAALRQQVLIAVIGSFAIFFVIAPIGGRFLHQWVARHVPEQATVALAGIVGIVFLLSFAITLGLLLRWGPALQIGLEASILLSVFSGVMAVGAMALAIRFTIRRTTPPTTRTSEGETQNAPSGAWGVWGEDARTRGKNMHRRKR